MHGSRGLQLTNSHCIRRWITPASRRSWLPQAIASSDTTGWPRICCAPDGRCAAGGGKLGAIHPRADDTLRRGIAQACRTLQGQTALLPLPGSDDPPLVAVVIPASAGASASFAAGLAQTALLLVKDPSRAPLPSGAVLGRVFGLTAAEARLTEALAAGKSIEQIGDERGTSRGTLRSQLKAAMAKTGTRRQGELIALSYRTVGFDTGEGRERRSYGTLPPFRRSPPPNPLTQGEGET